MGRIFIRDYVKRLKNQPEPEISGKETIAFEVDGDIYSVSFGDEGIEVMKNSTTTGNDKICITPEAGNKIVIR